MSTIGGVVADEIDEGGVSGTTLKLPATAARPPVFSVLAVAVVAFPVVVAEGGKGRRVDGGARRPLGRRGAEGGWGCCWTGKGHGGD